MISREKKAEIIKDLTEKLSKQKIVIFSDYTGLDVNQIQELRNQIPLSYLTNRELNVNVTNEPLEVTKW